MRDYGIVSPKFWIGETGKQLRGDPVAQLVALYLMTSPHANMTGIFHCPLIYVSHETGTPMQGTKKALRRLIEVGFCEYEEASETIFVVRMAAYQIAESLKADDKRVLGLKREVEKMASARLKQRFLMVYGRVFHLVPDDWTPSPSEAPSQPLPSQDQDQDHVQDQDHDQEQEQNTSSDAEPSDIDIVFEHWQSSHSPQSKLSDARRALIRKALKDYTAPELCQCISGYLLSPFHMGQNERSTKYNSIELILRNAQKIDAGLAFYAEPPKSPPTNPTHQTKFARVTEALDRA